jgi:hypothetical protein
MAGIDDALKLVASQHRNKPKFIALLTAVLQPVDAIGTLMENLHTYFDLDGAMGVQMDILGQVVGVSRALNFQPSGGASPVLEDDLYQLILKAKIAKNQWNGTTEQIIEIWNNLFPQIYLIISDNQNMSMSILIIGLSSQLQKDLVTNGYIIPKPQGVSIDYAYPETKVFAYGLDNDVFGGYNDGYWI